MGSNPTDCNYFYIFTSRQGRLALLGVLLLLLLLQPYQILRFLFSNLAKPGGDNLLSRTTVDNVEKGRAVNRSHLKLYTSIFYLEVNGKIIK